MDWVEVYESHTPYEWLTQQALAVVDPWGDDRADMRAAINTIAVRGDGDSQSEVMDVLLGYLEINKRPEPTVGPAAMRAAMEAMQ